MVVEKYVNNSRSILNAIIGLAMLANGYAIGKAVNEPVRIEPDKSYFLPIKYQDEVRISNDDYATAYRIDQKDVEEKLGEIASKSDREDSWIYRKRNGKGILIDIGRENKTRRKMPDGSDEIDLSSIDLSSIRFSTREIISYLEKGDEVTFYHIHPSYPLTYSHSRENFYGQFPSLTDFDTDFKFNRALPEGVKSNPSVVVGELATFRYSSNNPKSRKVVRNLRESIFWTDTLENELNEFTEELDKNGIFLETTLKIPLDQIK